jgi:hypothetical protein
MPDARSAHPEDLTSRPPAPLVARGVRVQGSVQAADGLGKPIHEGETAGHILD